jgi:hypothetical protein
VTTKKCSRTLLTITIKEVLQKIVVVTLFTRFLSEFLKNKPVNVLIQVMTTKPRFAPLTQTCRREL